MSSQSRTLKRMIQRDNLETAQPKAEEKKKATTSEVRLSPSARLQRVRAERKALEEYLVYGMVHDRKLNLMEKEDPKYIGMIAEEMGWSRSRLEKAIERIWDEARKGIENEDKRNAAQHNSQICSGGSEGLCDDIAGGRTNDGSVCGNEQRGVYDRGMGKSLGGADEHGATSGDTN